MEFCHLHCHTQYSLLDGAADIATLIRKAKEDGQNAIAITDHGNMFGVFEFVKEAQRQGIKPIIGCEFYLALNRLKKEVLPNFGNDDDGSRGKKAFHQVLLAKNETGYRNLIQLCSLGYIEGFYYYPRIDVELIAKYREGLIATTCCLGGIVPQHILYRSESEAEAVFRQWLDLFGPDYYVELQRHGIAEQERVNQVLIRFARKYGVKVIATNDIHYVHRQDAEAQEILLCLQTGKTLADTHRMRFASDAFYLKSASEMLQTFSDIPEALTHTAEIADGIEQLDLKRKVLLPFFPLPAPFQTNQQYLEHLTWQGARQRYPTMTPEIEERIRYELSVIERTGFAGYFLIVQDFIQAARAMQVSVGLGRGSAAGSLVAYCIGITNVDPIRFNLLFERFLNPERVTMPDMDIDFDDVGRQKVIDYVVQRYGKYQVAQIVTFGTMGPKTGIRDVGRVLGLPLSEANRLAKLVPEVPGITFLKAYEESPELAQLRHHSDELIRKTLRIAETLEGSVRNQGIHAAGIIIAPGDIRQLIPVCISKENDLLVTQYEGKLIEEAGLLKIDFLGLKTLTIVRDTVQSIYENHGQQIDIDNVPLDDPETFALFQRGETIGVFQFESEGMRKYLRELKPTHIEDLIAMNALYRPGPMNYIPDYIQRKHGVQKVEYPHPLLEKILSPTYGIMVYQEQIMQVAQVMAGFSLGHADLLRRAMGKKNKEEMQKQKAAFLTGAQSRGIDARTAEHVFTIMEKFAEYGFNRSHSAGYALLAFQTAYLKAHYPAEFMAATLTNYMDSVDNTRYYLEETRRLGIRILPPDVNESHFRFLAKPGKSIRYALAAIKGVGEGTVAALMEERNRNGPFRSVFDMTARVNLRQLNRKVLEALAAAGAFDGFPNTHRAQYFAVYERDQVSVLERAIRYGSQRQNQAPTQTLFDAVPGSAVAEPELPNVAAWSHTELLKREKEVTGVYLSGNPLDAFKTEMENFCTAKIGDLDPNSNREVSFAGIVSALVQKTTRTGTLYAHFMLEDGNHSIQLTVWGEDYARYRPLLHDGALLFVKGRYQQRFNNQNQREFKVSTMLPLQEVRRKLARKIEAQLPLHAVNPELIEHLGTLLTRFRGPVPFQVLLLDEQEKLTLTLVASVGIDPSDEFMQKAHNLGACQIRFTA